MNLHRTYRVFVFTIAMMLLTAERSSAGDKIDFEPVASMIQLPEGLTLGPCSAVDFDSKGRMYLFHRGKQPILCFDRSGNFIRSWGDNLIGQAHGLRVDRHDNVWVTDVGQHMVFQFSPEGKLLLALGQSGKPGNSVDQFNKPTDVAFGPEGEIYVSDGYGNSRVMKFAANGKYLGQWGEPGKGPGQFNLPHSIVIDGKGRVLVGDRENDRVQIFDTEGNLLEVWPGFAPYGMEYDSKGRLFVADGRANKVLQLNPAGKVVNSWGKKGNGSGEYDLPHMLAADAAGNLFIAEIGGRRLQTLQRKK
ncbi:peptidyl-alpha-hydroxyglycine alpha-amidating lyase family protein [uncultured Gimesia sp.]|uniref:peptidyl-alpha-hydroxyglycine alpha-amidating lyase family protein n=1 Tax=uncultured Gimesia sp. TaxID=1678688 RepID=UPI0030D7F1FD|tara:strand:- start:46117 stop:47031 length:915 start_codon:yes stop_codon:yes gene_type:complete